VRPAEGVSWRGLTAWGPGILTYLAIAGNLAVVGLPGLPALGASLPSLLVAGLAYLALSRRAPRPEPSALAP